MSAMNGSYSACSQGLNGEVHSCNCCALARHTNTSIGAVTVHYALEEDLQVPVRLTLSVSMKTNRILS